MGIIKYTRTHYEKKISVLEEYASQLEAHIQNLESLKERLKQTWDDEQGLSYYREINRLLQSCRNANSRINNLRIIWMDASGEMSKTEGLVSETADLLKSKVDALSIEGDS